MCFPRWGLRVAAVCSNVWQSGWQDCTQSLARSNFTALRGSIAHSIKGTRWIPDYHSPTHTQLNPHTHMPQQHSDTATAGPHSRPASRARGGRGWQRGGACSGQGSLNHRNSVGMFDGTPQPLDVRHHAWHKKNNLIKWKSKTPDKDGISQLRQTAWILTAEGTKKNFFHLFQQIHDKPLPLCRIVLDPPQRRLKHHLL